MQLERCVSIQEISCRAFNIQPCRRFSGSRMNEQMDDEDEDTAEWLRETLSSTHQRRGQGVHIQPMEDSAFARRFSRRCSRVAASALKRTSLSVSALQLRRGSKLSLCSGGSRSDLFGSSDSLPVGGSGGEDPDGSQNGADMHPERRSGGDERSSSRSSAASISDRSDADMTNLFEVCATPFSPVSVCAVVCAMSELLTRCAVALHILSSSGVRRRIRRLWTTCGVRWLSLMEPQER